MRRWRPPLCHLEIFHLIEPKYVRSPIIWSRRMNTIGNPSHKIAPSTLSIPRTYHINSHIKTCPLIPCRSSFMRQPSNTSKLLRYWQLCHCKRTLVVYMEGSRCSPTVHNQLLLAKVGESRMMGVHCYDAIVHWNCIVMMPSCNLVVLPWNDECCKC